MPVTEQELYNDLTKLWADVDSIANPSHLWELFPKAVDYAISASCVLTQGLASKSHVHDNGFMKLTLYESSDARYRIRLHIWDPPESVEYETNVHDHRYDFVSLIVAGGLENIFWDYCESGTAYKLFRYAPRDETGTYRLEFVERRRLCPRPKAVYSAGDAYFVKRDELHTARTVPNIRSATFCVQDRSNLKRQARTLSLTHPTEQSNISAPGLELDAYSSILHDIYESDMMPALRRYVS